MGKMVEMKRDMDMCDTIGHYDSDYPIGFFLDPKMVKELGLMNAKAGDELPIKGTIKIKTTTEGEDTKELYVCLKEMAVDGGPSKTATEKMSETYQDGAK